MKEKSGLMAMWLALLMLIASPLIGGVAASEPEMMIVCHNPGPNEVTVKVAAEAVEIHAAHGDIIGSPCADVFAQCTDGWRAEHTDRLATYFLEVDPDILEGRSTYVRTAEGVSQTLRVTVTSLSTGAVWRFNQPSCGTACGFLLGWLGGTTHPIGEGTGTYVLEVRQAQEGLVRLSCSD